MPLPVAILFIALILYPALQILSALVVRQRRRVLRRRQIELLGNPENSLIDQQVILDWTTPHRRLKLIPYLALPIAIPAVILSISLRSLFGAEGARFINVESNKAKIDRIVAEMERPGSYSSRVWQDPAFIEAEQIRGGTDILRMPTTLLLTAAMCIPLLPLIAISKLVGRSPMMLSQVFDRLRLTTFLSHLNG